MPYTAFAHQKFISRPTAAVEMHTCTFCDSDIYRAREDIMTMMMMMVSFISADSNTVLSDIEVPWHEKCEDFNTASMSIVCFVQTAMPNAIFILARAFFARSLISNAHLLIIYIILLIYDRWWLLNGTFFFSLITVRSVGLSSFLLLFFRRIYHWIVKWLKYAARPKNNRAFHFRALGSFALIITNDVCHTRSTPNYYSLHLRSFFSQFASMSLSMH